MANRRNKMRDGVLNFPGSSVIADSVTLTGAAVLTLVFPAKTVMAIITSIWDTGTVATACTITNKVATITFTKTTTGTFSYVIYYSISETQTSPITITTSTTQTPVA